MSSPEPVAEGPGVGWSLHAEPDTAACTGPSVGHARQQHGLGGEHEYNYMTMVRYPMCATLCALHADVPCPVLCASLCTMHADVPCPVLSTRLLRCMHTCLLASLPQQADGEGTCRDQSRGAEERMGRSKSSDMRVGKDAAGYRGTRLRRPGRRRGPRTDLDMSIHGWAFQG